MKYLWALLILSIFLAHDLSCQQRVLGPIHDEIEPAPTLFRIYDANSNAGFIDASGAVVIKPQFEDAGDFSESVAKVETGNKFGFVDTKGNIVIQPQFDGVGDFHNDRAWAQLGTDKDGFIDKDGNWICQADRGLIVALVQIQNFHENLCPFRTERKSPAGYIDQEGHFVIKPQFGSCTEFHEGLAAAVKNGDKDDKFGYIEKSGRMVIGPKFDDAGFFYEGMAPVRVGADKERRGGKWGYIDRNGSYVIQPAYGWARSFHDCLGMVADISDWQAGLPNHHFGFVDKTGKLVIDTQYSQAHDFSEGLANVRKDSKWGFIDTTGKIVINPQYDYAYPFSGGLARVIIGDQTSGKWGYIDKTGKFVWSSNHVPRQFALRGP